MTERGFVTRHPDQPQLRTARRGPRDLVGDGVVAAAGSATGRTHLDAHIHRTTRLGGRQFGGHDPHTAHRVDPADDAEVRVGIQFRCQPT